ncbi:hypothetical protein ACQP2Y_02295 [Actinoplanes sp. CA-051413]|uniref:hypothetical protein n=1 Tax=Actinoplanes sp. CA-051413 TaxID=3239899 RepID=UPI003D99742D
MRWRIDVVEVAAQQVVALACYGAVLGSFHSVLMALTSAVKLPLLFLVTLAPSWRGPCGRSSAARE